MTLSQKAIEEFKEIYKKEHGKELSDGDCLVNIRRMIL